MASALSLIFQPIFKSDILMRNAFLFSFFFLLSLGVAVPTATAAVHPAKAEIAEPAAETALSKQELRQQKRELRKQ